MLVLLSFGLVLVATVLLVLGLLADDGLTLIYISIACSVLAGVVLVVATRLGRPKSRAESSGPAPLSESSAPPAAEPAPAGAGVASAPVSESLPRTEPTTADTSFAPEPETAPLPPVETVPEEDEDFFPIADYDDLGVNEILPLLPELYADEIDVVEEKERSGKGRATILNRLAELREVLADAPPDTTAAQVIAERPRGTRKKAAAKATAKKTTAKKTAKKATGTRKKASSTAKKVVVEPTEETAKRAPATKKTTAKKATSKKAAPAKKAAKATKATKATRATKKA